jgi:hypothetical protein
MHACLCMVNYLIVSKITVSPSRPNATSGNKFAYVFVVHQDSNLERMADAALAASHLMRRKVQELKLTLD